MHFDRLKRRGHFKQLVFNMPIYLQRVYMPGGVWSTMLQWTESFSDVK